MHNLTKIQAAKCGNDGSYPGEKQGFIHTIHPLRLSLPCLLNHQ